MQSDSLLIDHLNRTLGGEAARHYQELPFFVMPNNIRDFLSDAKELLETAPDELEMPFEDFLVEFPFGTCLHKIYPGAPDRGRLWSRIRRLSAVKQDTADIPEIPDIEYIEDPRKWALLEGWEEKTQLGGPPPSPDYSLIPLTSPSYRDFQKFRHAYPNPDCLDARLFGLWCNLHSCPILDEAPEIALRCMTSELLQGTSCHYVVLALISISKGVGLP